MSDFTFIVKAYERPDALRRCLRSIRKHFDADVPVIVVDDGREPSLEEAKVHDFGTLSYIRPGYDIGLSAGRNLAVDECRTEFFVLLDDDFEVLPATTPERLIPFLRAGVYDLLGGLVLVRGRANYFHGLVRVNHTTLQIRSSREAIDGPITTDLVLNFFAARTETIRQVRWDDDLKLGEHVDFFLRCQDAGVRVGYYPAGCQANHVPARSAQYNGPRQEKARIHRELFMKKRSFTSIGGW